jgi:hypothetical protein
VDVEEVKKRDLDGFAGLLAKLMGREFDTIATRVADGKATRASDRLNREIVRKVSALREYGVFCGIDYAETEVVLRFDLTRLAREGIIGYLFVTPEPGTVPLYRWRHKGRGDHFYTTSINEPDRRIYESEGTVAYVRSQGISGAVPLYRWAGRKEHFYTTAPDGEAAPRAGCRFEGIAC